MKLDQTFSVTAPIDRVWATLMDVEQVARCVPGAQVLERLSDDSYRVGMKVKLGPITMAYRGQLDIIERDEAAHRATLSGKAKETRGQGTAAATVELHLASDAERTVGTVHADVRLSGRAAAMGQGIIASVADQMLGQFAHNLEVMLAGGAAGGDGVAETDGAFADDSRSGETVAEGVDRAAAGTQHDGVIAPLEDAKPGGSPVEQTRGDSDMTRGQVVSGTPADGAAPGAPALGMPVSGAPASGAPVSGAAQSMAGARVSDRIAGGAGPEPAPAPGPRADAGADSLDALALGRGVVAAQLQQPRVQLGLAVLLAVLAYLLGRRSARD